MYIYIFFKGLDVGCEETLSSTQVETTEFSVGQMALLDKFPPSIRSTLTGVNPISISSTGALVDHQYNIVLLPGNFLATF
jgi:hypothetical protein